MRRGLKKVIEEATKRKMRVRAIITDESPSVAVSLAKTLACYLTVLELFSATDAH